MYQRGRNQLPSTLSDFKATFLFSYQVLKRKSLHQTCIYTILQNYSIFLLSSCFASAYLSVLVLLPLESMWLTDIRHEGMWQRKSSRAFISASFPDNMLKKGSALGIVSWREHIIYIHTFTCILRSSAFCRSNIYL